MFIKVNAVHKNQKNTQKTETLGELETVHGYDISLVAALQYTHLSCCCSLVYISVQVLLYKEITWYIFVYTVYSVLLDGLYKNLDEFVYRFSLIEKKYLYVNVIIILMDLWLNFFLSFMDQHHLYSLVKRANKLKFDIFNLYCETSH